MELASQITRGAIENIFRSGRASDHPVVQVTDLKRISNGATTASAARFRLSISDGTHFQQAMIATQLNSYITDNRIKVNSLIRLVEVICNAVQDKCIVIILAVDVVGDLPMKVGSPQSIDLVMNPRRGASANQNPQLGPPSVQNPIPPVAQQPPRPGGFDGFPPQGSVNGSHHQPSFPAQQVHTGSTNPWSGQQARPNPFSGASGAIAKMGSSQSAQFRPIQSINPYQNGWTIHGRCTFKSELRKFQNARGDGQVISFELTDDSGSIRITGFTQMAQKIDELVHLNRIFKVSKGSLKPANERYNRSTSSFEMTLDQSSILEEEADDGTVHQVKYNFKKISELESVPVKDTCDVVGVVTAVGDLSEIVIRSTGEPCARRTVTITDDSNASVELTLWRTQAETFITEEAASSHPVLLMRNAIRGDFGGVSLNVGRLTALELNPVSVPEANRLRSWFDNGGMTQAIVQSVTATAGGAGGGPITGPRKSLLSAKVEDVEPTFSQGRPDATITYVTRALVSFVNTKSDMYYPGDPETKKKVVSQGDGMWVSESSGKTLSDDQIVWRFVISMKIADYSSSSWVSAFDEVGPLLFGRTASQMRDLKDNDLNMFEHVVEEAMCKPLLLKVAVKERTWRDATQIRHTVSKAEPLDYATEGRVLLEEIKSRTSN